MKSITQKLHNWVKSLDSAIGDTEEEIQKRRIQNVSCVNKREDLYALIDYINKNDLPPAVERALVSCLSWNPFANTDKP